MSQSKKEQVEKVLSSPSKVDAELAKLKRMENISLENVSYDEASYVLSYIVGHMDRLKRCIQLSKEGEPGVEILIAKLKYYDAQCSALEEALYRSIADRLWKVQPNFQFLDDTVAPEDNQ